MPERYAELKLYFGFISDTLGRGEGRFEREPTNETSRRIIAQNRQFIEERLQPGWREHGLNIGWGDDCVASNEEEALLLIAHAEANCKKASGMVIPFDRIHGSTRFHRVIRFSEITRDRSEEIISIMKQSGHLPCTREEFRMPFRDFNEEEFRQENDRRWRAALKFYP